MSGRDFQSCTPPVLSLGDEPMAYRFATEQADYQDLASGFVLHSAPGFPGFPVRLASEMFQRARAHVPEKSTVVLWDALCGSGYLATVLGFLHPSGLEFVLASDADEEAARLASRNLALLAERGLRDRREALTELAAAHGKSVHHRAAQAAGRLIERLGRDLPYAVRGADVFDPPWLPVRPDVVLSDVPYGDQTHWLKPPEGGDPIGAAIRSIAATVPPRAVIAFSSRTRKISLDGGVPVLERFRIGLRAVVLVRAGEVSPR